jgi:SAM-dependent methyltransferase
MITAAERWHAQLAEWAIPQTILDAAPESPWGFDPEVFARRAEAAQSRLTPSNERALEALPEGGSVLDVGCGGGAASVPLAGRASGFTGVDGSADMLAIYRERLGDDAETVQGRWPDIAGRTPAADVAVCHHVFYNVPDLAMFAAQLTSHARARVVVELTRLHPMSRLNDLWLRLQQLRRPSEPTVDDAVAVLQELGLQPQRFDWAEPEGQRMLTFASPDDLVGWIRRRLCLTADRDEDIWAAAQDSLTQDGGMWTFPSMGLVTLWWPGEAEIR